MRWIRRVAGLLICLAVSYLVFIQLAGFVSHSRGVHFLDKALFLAFLSLQMGLCYLGYRLIRS